MLPSDLLILRPWPSTVKPCVSRPRYGARPSIAQADQQRAVEPAAVLVVAFEVQVGLGAGGVKARVTVGLRCEPRSTWKKVEPESNQTSRMSVLLR